MSKVSLHLLHPTEAQDVTIACRPTSSVSDVVDDLCRDGWLMTSIPGASYGAIHHESGRMLPTDRPFDELGIGDGATIALTLIMTAA